MEELLIWATAVLLVLCSLVVMAIVLFKMKKLNALKKEDAEAYDLYMKAKRCKSNLREDEARRIKYILSFRKRNPQKYERMKNEYVDEQRRNAEQKLREGEELRKLQNEKWQKEKEIAEAKDAAEKTAANLVEEAERVRVGREKSTRNVYINQIGSTADQIECKESLDLLRSIRRWLRALFWSIVMLVILKGCDGTNALLRQIDDGIRAPREYRGTIRSY